MSARLDDLRMLLELTQEHFVELYTGEQRAFVQMLNELQKHTTQLSDRQRAWVKRAHGRVSPQYENLVSSGKVSQHSTVESMITRKVLRPPPRRTEE